ncbi:hypothetical protein SPHINGO361_70076 [Sphingomonas sp. EC-HK361]|nr:hypothetical protein SPHINGO361_70076 [Sphingomonas sp. EC-HK361]
MQYRVARAVLPAIGFAPELNPNRLCQSESARKSINAAETIGNGVLCGCSGRDAWTSAACAIFKRKNARSQKNLLLREGLS